MRSSNSSRLVALTFLLVCLLRCTSFSFADHFLSVTVPVGDRAVLPCSWRAVLEDLDSSSCHIQWRTIAAEIVFEQWGALKWQADEYQNRVNVPEDNLGSGDCSLLITDVQHGDTGKYESFMMVEEDQIKSRTRTRTWRKKVFLQAVSLLVTDYRSSETRPPGKDLVLDLRTPRSDRVAFQGRNSSEWSVLWVRGDHDTQRLEKHPHQEQLTIKNLRHADQGTYQVLDQHGQTVSSVDLTVDGFSSTEVSTELQGAATGGGSSSSRSSVLLVLAAVAALL